MDTINSNKILVKPQNIWLSSLLNILHSGQISLKNWDDNIEAFLIDVYIKYKKYQKENVAVFSFQNILG